MTAVLRTSHHTPRPSSRLERRSPAIDLLLRLIDVQLIQLTRAHVINQAMDLQPPLSDCIQHHRIVHQCINPTPHIQLHELQSLRLLIHTLEQLQILPPQLPQRHQPHVNQPQLLVIQRRRNPTTGGVSAHDDVLDFQVLHGILDDRQRVEVRGDEDVGDVAVDEDVAGVEAEDGRFWAAGVGTADPEDLWGLAL
jgi:hypothetical protein